MREGKKKFSDHQKSINLEKERAKPASTTWLGRERHPPRVALHTRLQILSSWLLTSWHQVLRCISHQVWRISVRTLVHKMLMLHLFTKFSHSKKILRILFATLLKWSLCAILQVLIILLQSRIWPTKPNSVFSTQNCKHYFHFFMEVIGMIGTA